MMSLKPKAGFYHEGFTYTCKDATKDWAIYNWHCSATKCPARITTEKFAKFLAEKLNAPHNHNES